MITTRILQIFSVEKKHNSCSFRLLLFYIVGIMLIAEISHGEESQLNGETNGSLLDLPLEELMQIDVEVVSSASKYQQKVTEAPANISVVSAEDIKRYGFRTLSEILNSLGGFYTTNGRDYSYTGVRGFSRPGDFDTRILYLLDGHRLNESLFGSVGTGFDAIIDIGLIERIEVIRGPGSTLYGANAQLAVINIISKKGTDLKGREVSASAGTFDSYKQRVSFGNAIGDRGDYTLSFSGYDSNGDTKYFVPGFNTPATNNGIAINNDAERANNFFASLNYEGLAIEAAYVSRVRDVPTAPYGTIFNDPEYKVRDDRSFISASYNRKLYDSIDVTLKVAYDYYQYKGDYPYYYSTEDSPEFRVLNKDGCVRNVPR